jgi:large subunit ribosomal protein L32e
MAGKDDILKTLISLKGIGKAKADALIDAGFDTIEKIQQASIVDLSKVNGISEAVATSIKDQLPDQQVTASDKTEKRAKETTEKQVEKQPKTETLAVSEKKESKIDEKKSIDTPDGYIVKKKPSLSKEVHHYLAVRKEKKKHTPQFYRGEWFRYKKLSKSWRCPDGITSKMRINKKYRPARVRVGFRGPKNVRGLHPSGFEEVLVYNVSDLEKINADVQAARIAGAVGTKKRVAIAEKAKELDIRLLNK